MKKVSKRERNQFKLKVSPRSRLSLNPIVYVSPTSTALGGEANVNSNENYYEPSHPLKPTYTSKRFDGLEKRSRLKHGPVLYVCMRELVQRSFSF